MKRVRIGALALLAMLITIGLLPRQEAVYAQDEQAKGSIVFATQPLRDGDDATANRVVMVSVIRGGSVVRQTEMHGRCLLGYGFAAHDLLASTYDVRVEGEGVKTVIKRGIVVNPKQDTQVTFIVEPGAGTKVIEYSSGGLSRDETASLLRKLVADVEDLKKSIDELKKK